MSDPGLQAQRTVLAWIRTGIGCGGLAVLLVRHAIMTGRVVDAVAATVAGAACALVLMLGRLRRSEPPSRRYVVLTTVLVAAIGVVVLAGLIPM